MAKFPTLTDLAFFNARREPGWARLIPEHKTPRRDAPNIDHVICAHARAGMPTYVIDAANLMVFIAGWRRRGEPVIERLRQLAVEPACAIRPAKRAALAKRWADRLEKA